MQTGMALSQKWHNCDSGNAENNKSGTGLNLLTTRLVNMLSAVHSMECEIQKQSTECFHQS